MSEELLDIMRIKLAWGSTILLEALLPRISSLRCGHIMEKAYDEKLKAF